MGEIRQAHVFVGLLAASSYTYAKAQWAEDLPNWIGGHVRDFAFFGGVPEIIVPDNTTTGVKHPPATSPTSTPPTSIWPGTMGRWSSPPGCVGPGTRPRWR